MHNIANYYFVSSFQIVTNHKCFGCRFKLQLAQSLHYTKVSEILENKKELKIPKPLSWLSLKNHILNQVL